MDRLPLRHGRRDGCCAVVVFSCKWRIECLKFVTRYEESSLCDYEIATDALSSQIGMAHALLPMESPLRPVLLRLLELVYHMNGSLRGKNAIGEMEVAWIRQLDTGDPTVRGKGVFVLPQGCPAAAAMHVARCQAKVVVRMLGKLRKQGVDVPPEILSFANHTANVLFRLAEKSNAAEQIAEVVFETRSY
jgi:cob(I)alamin adenosyltransferase